MNKLINSAMMPTEGHYKMSKISQQRFINLLRESPFESYIGYPDTAKLIEKITGIEIPISRSRTTLKSGDRMIVCKLKYRLADPDQKGKTTPSAEDFEFFEVAYYA